MSAGQFSKRAMGAKLADRKLSDFVGESKDAVSLGGGTPKRDAHTDFLRGLTRKEQCERHVPVLSAGASVRADVQHPAHGLQGPRCLLHLEHEVAVIRPTEWAYTMGGPQTMALRAGAQLRHCRVQMASPVIASPAWDLFLGKGTHMNSLVAAMHCSGSGHDVAILLVHCCT